MGPILAVIVTNNNIPAFGTHRLRDAVTCLDDSSRSHNAQDRHSTRNPGFQPADMKPAHFSHFTTPFFLFDKTPQLQFR